MLKNIALLVVSLLIGFWALIHVWQWINQNRTVQIGWNANSAFEVDSLNQLGFRGKKFQPKSSAKEKIILFVGDSQVEADGLPYKFMIENLVQKYLQEADTTHIYKCYSIGAGGFGEDQEFLALKEYFKKFQADKVLLWFTPENDVWNNIFPTHWPVNANPKPTYWIENGQLKGPNFQWLQYYPDPNQPKWKQSFFALDNLDSKWESKLPPPYQSMKASGYKGPLSRSPIGEEGVEIDKSHYTIFFTPRSERMKYGIQLTRFLLDSMQQLCRVNHAEFSTFIALNNEVVAMPDTDFSVEHNDRIYRLSKKMYFNNINDIMQGFDFHLFTLNTEWKQLSRQDNHHFNHEAQQEIAHKIVERICCREPCL